MSNLMSEINDISQLLGSMNAKIDVLNKNVDDMRLDVKEINKSTIIHERDIAELKLHVAEQKKIAQDYLQVKNKGIGIFATISVAGGALGGIFIKVFNSVIP